MLTLLQRFMYVHPHSSSQLIANVPVYRQETGAGKLSELPKVASLLRARATALESLLLTALDLPEYRLKTEVIVTPPLPRVI